MLRGCVVWAGCPYLLPFYFFTFLLFYLFTFLLLIHSALRPVATVEVAVSNSLTDMLHLHTF